LSFCVEKLLFRESFVIVSFKREVKHFIPIWKEAFIYVSPLDDRKPVMVDYFHFNVRLHLGYVVEVFLVPYHNRGRNLSERLLSILFLDHC
jgi:hypothetical protein